MLKLELNTLDFTHNKYSTKNYNKSITPVFCKLEANRYVLEDF